MNILEINLNKRWGGAEINLLQLCTALQTSGQNVFLGARRGSKLMKKATSAGIKVLPLFSINQIDFISIMSLLYYLKKYSIDVINTHTPKDHFVAGIAGKLLSIPVVLTKRTCFPIKSHLPNRWLYFNLVDKIIAISNAVKNNLIKCLNIDNTKVETIFSGVRTEEFYDKNRYDEWLNNLTDSKGFIVTTISRLDENKGLEDFIRAASIVSQSIPNVRFVIVGYDEVKIRHKLEKLAETLKIKNKVLFTGFVSNVKQVLYETDIFVRNAIYEALGLGVIEAMSTGRAVISTNVGGLPEVVRDGVTGILIPPKNPGVLSEKIIYLLKNIKVIKDMSSNALKVAREKFHINKLTERTLSVYEETIKCKKNSRQS